MVKKYTITGLDCPNCAAKLEAKLNEVEGVEEAVLTFAIEQLKITAEEPDKLLEELQRVADSMEDGVEIKPLVRGKKTGKSRRHEHQHEHEHHHHHDGECGCGHEHHHEHGDEHHHAHEHEHHHEDGECGCGHEHHHEHEDEHHHDHEHEHHHDHEHHHEHEGEHHHHDDKCSCGHDHDHKHHHDHEHEHDHEHHHNHDHEHHHEHEHHDEAEHSHDSKKEKQPLSDTQKELLWIGLGVLVYAISLIFEHVLHFAKEAYIQDYLVAYLILGGGVLYAAIKNIGKGQIFDENFLMSIATIGAFIIGEYPEAVGVMLFYRIGELFEEIAVAKSRKQIMEAADMRPEVVYLLEGDETVEIDAEDALVGDIIVIRPGDRIPLDGVVVKGESRLDTSPVTGEPVPIAIKEGSEIYSGCVNDNGLIHLKVTKALEESMVTRILDSVENAAASKPEFERFITRFARIYTPIVVAVALLTAIVPSLITGEWGKWIYTALTFLVISCPCALVLSVPLAFFAGIGAGSKQGILFKGGVALEALNKVNAVIMDKTGTITKGDFSVQKGVGIKGVDEEKLILLAASIESSSTHPIAKSVIDKAKELVGEDEFMKAIAGKATIDGIMKPEKIEEIAGHGLKVTFKDGEAICGSKHFLTEEGIDLTAYEEAIAKENVVGAEVLVAFNGNYMGYLVIADSIKDDSVNAISSMRSKGLFTVMLTGDNEETANAVASEAGLDRAYAKLLPDEKLEKLEELRDEQGSVMFVGDGINDAPVLAGADVGAAMGSGADAAIEAADVVFMNSSLMAVPESVRIARKAVTVSMENVIFALLIKASVMVLGLLGIASMWYAVFADSGVAMLCVLNSIRVLRVKKQS